MGGDTKTTGVRRILHLVWEMVALITVSGARVCLLESLGC